MPQVSFRQKNEMVLRIEPTDSMGRTQELIDAMEKNAVKPPKIRGADKAYADSVAVECSVYPKAMYRLALKQGKPAGDEVNPSYPMPYDLAQALGIEGKILGKTKDSGGYIQQRHPYQSKLVGVIRPDGSVDLEASQAAEKKMIAEGWVDSITKVEGIPALEPEQPFDLPPAKKRQQPTA